MQDDPRHETRETGIAPDMTEKEREENKKLREEPQQMRDEGGRSITEWGTIINIEDQHYDRTRT